MEKYNYVFFFFNLKPIDDELMIFLLNVGRDAGRHAHVGLQTLLPTCRRMRYHLRTLGPSGSETYSASEVSQRSRQLLALLQQPVWRFQSGKKRNLIEQSLIKPNTFRLYKLNV